MFEWNVRTSLGSGAPSFHLVHDEDIDLLTRPGTLPRQVVRPGVERDGVGLGSIRIHRRDVQAKVFEAVGFSDDEARRRFGYLLDAWNTAPPPHGGIALG
jgi:aspartyl-tRNA synthetase